VLGYAPAQLVDGGHRASQINRGDPREAIGVLRGQRGDVVVRDQRPVGAPPRREQPDRHAAGIRRGQGLLDARCGQGAMRPALQRFKARVSEEVRARMLHPGIDDHQSSFLSHQSSFLSGAGAPSITATTRMSPRAGAAHRRSLAMPQRGDAAATRARVPLREPLTRSSGGLRLSGSWRSVAEALTRSAARE
jgi:hypothetical protein